MEKTLYMKVSEEDISKYVLFSGDPFRVNRLIKYLDNPTHVAFAREFNTYTGYYKGIKVTITSTGIGGPSAAIAMEEMYSSGMEVAVRMGTVMGLRSDLLGKFIIPKKALRKEGTSYTYAPESFEAIADISLVECMNESVVNKGMEFDNGLNCTLDGFYSQMKESRLSKKLNTNVTNTFSELKELGVAGIDMETSVILTLGRLMGIAACTISMTTVLENLSTVLKGKSREQSEEDLCLAALDGIVLYHKRSEVK